MEKEDLKQNQTNEEIEEQEIFEAISVAQNLRDEENKMLDECSSDEKLAYLLKTYKASADDIKKSKLKKYEGK